MDALEVWGGVECTVNRVGDGFHNQLQRSGHDRRLSDLQRIADLGVRRLRYPVLWELTAPHAPGEFDWRWTDQRLARLRELGVDPIAGLVHHGSGPRYTCLLDARFPEFLADYARAVAARYPWIERYTPINEPLTTARFSALYGHWYPHRQDDRSFVRALLNQCRATVLAMREIRRTNSKAQLIQTDDVGYTTSTAQLAYQAQFDNERRWLTWDLLCGKVDSHHPLWKYLCASGASETDLAFFQEHPCPPDVIGVNHYVTSDRHLNEQRQLFDGNTWGGNGKHAYADVELVRASAESVPGFTGALRDAWDRYRLPLAITEVHLGCTREEQLRWLWQAWTEAQQLRADGADLRAVTTWALFGSFDWNSLLTTDAGYYEPGAFDVRHPEPHPTALAKLVKAMAVGTQFEPASVLEAPGWWRRPERLFASLRSSAQFSKRDQKNLRPVLLTGDDAVLEIEFDRVCEARGLSARVCARAQLDVCDFASIERVLDAERPWALVNATGRPPAADCHHQRLRYHRENIFGTALLARACVRRGISFLTLPPVREADASGSHLTDLIHPALDRLLDGHLTDVAPFAELAIPTLPR